MDTTASVLIVDRSADNREVLRTVLERQGLRVFEAAEAESGLALARNHQPDVIVFDAESGDVTNDRQAAAVLAAYSQRSRLLVLGQCADKPRLAGLRQLAKPYHFGPLVHTIHQLAAKAA
jgi:CheY-like chemotaxis protein